MVYLHLSGFDDLVCDGFLHEINLGLSNDLHHLILQRNSQFAHSDAALLLLLGTASQSFNSLSSASLGNVIGHERLVILHGRIDQEWIVLHGETEVL